MIAPGALVMLAPLIAGTLFGVHAVYGLLTGMYVSIASTRTVPIPFFYVMNDH